MYRCLILATVLLALCANAQTQFSPGDWQSWRDFRGARALDASAHDLYVASSGGILVYDLNRGRWDDPYVMGYGPFEAVPIDDALLLLHDENLDYLWVTTRDKLLRWNRGLDRWEIARENIWPLGERPVNIGISDQSLYVETIPERIFDQLFNSGSPIPDPIWYSYVRRYSGDRFTGNLFVDMKPMGEDNVPIRWRGLRAKIPLRDSDYPPGVLGVPPAGFPMLLAPRPFQWLSDGSLLDTHNRTYPITDWLIDNWNGYWTTHWGAGILRTDLRGLRSEQQLVGPAGNDVRALLIRDREMWIGGANEGDFMGVSIMQDYGDSWNYFERRDDAQIRSTVVSDFAFANERVWLATADGLLSYNPKKKLWKRYDVQDNLQSQRVTALAAQGFDLWIGTDDGLSVLNTRTNNIDRVQQTAFELGGVTDLLVDDSTVWVGTGNGLYRMNAATRAAASVDMDHGLLFGPVRGLTMFGTALWAVTPNGLLRREANGDSKSWLADNWMKQTEPTCITARDPYVWVGTDGGLFRFQPDRESWEHYTRRDGLVDDRVQVVKEDRGDIWIGTSGGLTRFYYNRSGKPR